LIDLQDICKSYGKPDGGQLNVIDNVNLSMEDRSFTTIIGPSGCGKSTLLGIIAGLIPPERGRVIVGGQEVKSPRPDMMSVVFQDPGLLPWRTVMGNVEFPLELRGVKKAQRREVAGRYISLVNLNSFKNYYPSQLSGGMQQRVNLARALATEPKILLMDEPFGALDEGSRLEMGKELTRIWQQTGVTIVFVTHSLLEAAYLADKIVVLAGKPSKVTSVVEVKAKRPRDVEDPELVEIRRQLWGLLIA
jgi:NitT/TauT family transport system ATP-binding protein